MSITHVSRVPLTPIAAALIPAPGSLQASDDGLTPGEILAAVPHDAAAFVVYALLGLGVYLVWWAHRHSGGGGDREGKEGDDPLGGGEPDDDGRRPRRAA